MRLLADFKCNKAKTFGEFIRPGCHLGKGSAYAALVDAVDTIMASIGDKKVAPDVVGHIIVLVMRDLYARVQSPSCLSMLCISSIGMSFCGLLMRYWLVPWPWII